MTFGGIIKGGLAAGLFINLSGFVLNFVSFPEGSLEGSIAFFVAYTFLLGILIAYVYAVARTRWGAGPKEAAAGAGAGVWCLHSVLNLGAMDVSTSAWSLIDVVELTCMAIAGVIAGRVQTEA